MALPGLETIQDQRILLDSNVLIYCGDSDLKVQARGILRSLADHGNSLAISDICVFEVLKNRLGDHAFDYYVNLLKYLDKVSIHRPALANAAKLGHLYKEGRRESEDKTKQGSKGAHTGDLIIGGTAIFHESLILTCDKSEGFNWKHWEPIAQGHMLYEEGNAMNLINIYLIRYKLQDSLPDGFLTMSTMDGNVVSMAAIRGESQTSSS